MKENICINSHKLIYHPKRVADWLEGKLIYPINLEVALSSYCNHRCIFCSVGKLGYKKVLMDKKIILSNLQLLSNKGLKSVLFAGEGEPLVNENASDIISETNSYGIDVALSTNGVLFNKEKMEICLPSLSWVRFSVAGIREETYEKIHKCRKGDLKKIINNLNTAVEIKKSKKLKVTLGVQLLLLNDNKNEVIQMAKELKKIGVDYFVIKPFLPHPQVKNILDVNYEELLFLENELKSLVNKDFNIYFRKKAMKKLNDSRPYNLCRGLDFLANIGADGSVWPCCGCIGSKEYVYGNLYKNSFIDIWNSTKKGEVLRKLAKMNDEICYKSCKMDEINIYLNDLVNPGLHNNFI